MVIEAGHVGSSFVFRDIFVDFIIFDILSTGPTEGEQAVLGMDVCRRGRVGSDKGTFLFPNLQTHLFPSHV